jgi:hypothetical protein
MIDVVNDHIPHILDEARTSFHGALLCLNVAAALYADVIVSLWKFR